MLPVSFTQFLHLLNQSQLCFLIDLEGDIEKGQQICMEMGMIKLSNCWLINKQKQKLIKCLKDIQTKGEKGKLAKLDRIQELAQYCHNNRIQLKQICKYIVIQKLDPDRKKAYYRTQDAIEQLLQYNISYLESIGQFEPKYSLDTPQLLKILQYQPTKMQQRITIRLDHYADMIVQHGTLPDSLLKQVQKIKLQNLVQLYITNITKQIRQNLQICEIIVSLKQTIIRNVKKQNVTVLNQYISSIPILNNFQNITNTSIIKSSFKTMLVARQYLHVVTNKSIQKYLLAINPLLSFKRKKQINGIFMVQNNIRSFLSRKRLLLSLQQLYMEKYEGKKLCYQKQFLHITHNINKMLEPQIKSRTFGIQCSLHLISISTWANTQQFSPTNVLSLFQTAIKNKKKSPIIKISMKKDQLKLVTADGGSYTLGYSSNEQDSKVSEAIFDSEDGKSGFKMDLHGKLMGKGDNLHGQLGIGLQKDEVGQWTRVKIKEKVKLLDCRGKKTVCLTEDGEIYKWGFWEGKTQYSPLLLKKPSFLCKKTVKSICCGFGGLYVMTEQGQIYQWEKGLCRNCKGWQKGQKMLLMTGNSILQIVYSLNINFQCYDKVKIKKILKWIKKSYGLQEEEDRLMCDQNNINWSNRFYTKPI